MKQMLEHFQNVEKEYRFYLDKKQAQDKKISRLENSENQEGLVKIQTLIQKSVGCSVEDLIGALSMCAFAPGSKLLAASQIADLGIKSFTPVTNNSGVHISKKYLIKKIMHCSQDVKEMITGYRELQDGTLEAEDEAGNLLLISSEDMSGLLGSLEDIFPEEAWKLKKDFKKFSDTVLEQNQKILEYNECGLQIQEKQAEASQHAANQRKPQYSPS